LFRFGRETFQEAAKIVQGVDSSAIKWKDFRYVVFDILSFGSGPYTQRYKELGKNLSLRPPNFYVEFMFCKIRGKAWRREE